MPNIKRSDGVQFVLQPYRELLTEQPRSALKRELQSLAQKHGEYVSFFKRDGNQFEAIFARELGYLLGETVWHYFNRPNNLLLCEALPEENQALLVVVKSGKVYIDVVVSYHALADELAFLAASSEQYDVYVSGAVPLTDTVGERPDAVVLEKENIHSFNVLPEPVLPKLPLVAEFRLQPLMLVLASPHFKNKYIVPFATIMASALLIFLVWYMFFTPGAQQPIVSTPKDPYVLYNDALTAPAPDKLLTELSNVIALCAAIGGWEATDLTYQDGQYTIKVRKTMGDGQQIKDWADLHKVGISGDIDSGEATLTMPTKLGKRLAPPYIYNVNKVLNLVSAKMQLVASKEDIAVSNTSVYGQVKSIDFMINVKNFAPFAFNLVGKFIKDMPVTVSSVTLSAAQNLFSGSIKLTIWGN